MSDEPIYEAAQFSLKLRIGHEVLTATGQVTNAPLRIADFLPILHSISGAIEGAVLRRAEKEGKRISCRSGCAACCRQPVPISQSEALHLSELIEEMPQARRREIRERFRAAHRTLEEHGLLERLRRLTEVRDPDVRQAFGLEYLRLRIPCPFLEDENCAIHSERPLSCREYLVTSPAEFCEDPNPVQVQMVKLPQKLSYLLFRFGDGTGEDDIRWLPLIFALERGEVERDDPPPRYPGKTLFDNFVQRLAASLEGGVKS